MFLITTRDLITQDRQDSDLNHVCTVTVRVTLSKIVISDLNRLYVLIVKVHHVIRGSLVVRGGCLTMLYLDGMGRDVPKYHKMHLLTMLTTHLSLTITTNDE